MGALNRSDVLDIGLVLKHKGVVGDVGVGTCVSNAVTLNTLVMLVTTEALTTAAGASQAITVTSNKISAADVALVTRAGGTSTTGSVEISAVCTANTLTITLTNRHATVAFNGTFILAVQGIKASLS